MKYAWIALTMIMLALLGCQSGQPAVEGDVIARVNDEALTREELMALSPADVWETSTPAERQAWAEDWKRMTLLSQLAQEEGLSDDPAVKSRVRNSIGKTLANAVLAKRLQQSEPAEDAFEKAMHEYYQTQYDKTRYDFTVQMLTVYDEALAGTVWEEIQSGVSYYDVYQRHSNAAIAYTRGSMNRIALSQPLYAALSEAQRYHSVQATSEGRREIARFLDRREVELPFDHPEVQADIRRVLTDEREKELIEQIISEREAVSEIVIEL